MNFRKYLEENELIEANLANSDANRHFNKYIKPDINSLFKVVGDKGLVDLYDDEFNNIGVTINTEVKVISNKLLYDGKMHYVSTDKGLIKINRFVKPAGTTVNRGDLAEGILFAATYLKHTLGRTKSGIKKISTSEVFSFIKNIKWKETNKISSFVRTETIPGVGGINDKVIGELYLKKSSAENLTNINILNSITDIIDEALDYVNSRNFERFVKLLHVNEKENEISIQALGPLDERGTKIDLKIIIDGKETRFNKLSLKRGSNQIGQRGIGGLGLESFDKMSEYFMTYLNIDMHDFKDEYINLYIDDEKIAGIEAASVAIKKFNSLRDKNDVIANALIKSSFGDEDISLLQLNKKVKLNRNSFITALEKITDIKAVNKSKVQGTMLIVGKFLKTDIEICKIRFKFTSKEKRIYFEIQPSFNTMINKY